jgi:hypothetical protein
MTAFGAAGYGPDFYFNYLDAMQWIGFAGIACSLVGFRYGPRIGASISLLGCLTLIVWAYLVLGFSGIFWLEATCIAVNLQTLLARAKPAPRVVLVDDMTQAEIDAEWAGHVGGDSERLRTTGPHGWVRAGPSLINGHRITFPMSLSREYPKAIDGARPTPQPIHGRVI